MIRLATRRSPLALAQARLAAARIEDATKESVEIVPLSSLGDEDQVRPLARFLEPGAFTGRLDQALLDGEADVAVHSLKDVPLRPVPGLTRTYVIERADPADLLVLAIDRTKDDLADRRIGTSAPRRRSQLRAHAEDAIAVDVRGSIGTRLQRVADDELDALFVAAAALERGRDRLPDGATVARLPLATWPTAPGQGALVLQTREDDPAQALLAQVEDADTARAVAAERGLLADLGGGCGTPLGATALPPGHPEGEARTWTLHVTYPDPQGTLHRYTIHAERPAACRERAFDALQRDATSETREAPLRTREHVLLIMDPETSPHWQRRLYAEGCAVTYWWPFKTIDRTRDDALRARLRTAYTTADWVLVTSARSVPACHRLHEETRVLPRFAVVGPATARAMHEAGLPVTLVPPTARGVDLARLLAGRAASDGARRVLWPSGNRVTAATEEALQEADLDVTRIPVYSLEQVTTQDPPKGPFDAVLFASPHTAHHTLSLLDPSLMGHPVAIGDTTAAALAEHGINATPLPAPTPTAFLQTIRSG